MPSPGSKAVPEAPQRSIYKVPVGHSKRIRNNQSQSQSGNGTLEAGTGNTERASGTSGPEGNPILLRAPLKATSDNKRPIQADQRIQ